MPYACIFQQNRLKAAIGDPMNIRRNVNVCYADKAASLGLDMRPTSFSKAGTEE